MSHTAYLLRFVWSLVWTVVVGRALFRLLTVVPEGLRLWSAVGWLLVWVLMVLPRYWWPGRVGWAWALMAGFPMLNVMLNWATPQGEPAVPAAAAMSWAYAAGQVTAFFIVGAGVWLIGVLVQVIWRKVVSLGRTHG